MTNKGKFNIQFNANVEKKLKDDGKPEYFVNCVGSSVIEDRQGDIMSTKALNRLQEVSSTKAIPVFSDHDHSWKSTMGYIHDSQIHDGLWSPVVKLEDPEFNKDSELLIRKQEHGTPIGISIGGRVIESHFEKKASGSVRVIDDIELYELSFVGIPANQNGSVISYIAKSLGDDMVDNIVAESKPVEEIAVKAVEPIPVVEQKVEDLSVTKKDFEELRKSVIEEIAKELAKLKAEPKALVESGLEAKSIDSKPTEDNFVEKLMEKM